MVAPSEQLPKQSANNADHSPIQLKKKKRPNRQRNRPRNKRNRLANNNTTEESIQVETTSHQEEFNQQTKSPSTLSKAHTESITIEMGSPDHVGQQSRSTGPDVADGKTREQILAEREAKKLAKQAKKVKSESEAQTVAATTSPIIKPNASDSTKTAPKRVATDSPTTSANSIEKTREQIKAEREAKKAAKQALKTAKATGGNVDGLTQKITNLKVSPETAPPNEAAQVQQKPTLTKAERRAIQEAQRAAKAQAQAQKSQPSAAKKTPVITAKPTAAAVTTPSKGIPEATSPAKSSPTRSQAVHREHDCKVKLFNHLDCAKSDVSRFINDPQLHPSIARLGVQYAKRTIVGSNARCIAFLNALKSVVQDFETPPKKEFARSLEAAVKHHVEHLHRCRPLAVSVSNAYKQFKNQLLQLAADKPETDLKEILSHFIDTYLENQIGKAALAISASLQEKITDGDVLLTFGCSSLIDFICEGAKNRKVDFRVIVVDSRPYCEGQELLRRLTSKGIPCTYVLINAVSFVMPEATKVLLGAHALLSNGYVMARTGTAQVALVAHSYNVPVLVCCETHKFSERFQTDAIVYNELGNPDDLVMNEKCCLSKWQTKNKMTPLNLNYDITPPELVTAVVTEVSILPCTSVPVILRIKPDIGC